VLRRRLGLGVAVVAAGVLVAVFLAGGGSGGSGGAGGAHGARGPRGTRGARGSGRRATSPAGEVAPVAHATTKAPRAPVDYAASPQMRRLIALGRPIYCAGRHGDEVALTFDDGPGPYTRLVVAKLRKHRVHATFFVVGRNIELVPGATRAERAIGAVGDHTYTHPLLTSLSPAAAEHEIVRTQRALERSTRAPIVLFRPPYGGHDATIDAIARAHGLLEILWTVDSADSLGANYAQIEHNVIAGLHPGSIVLMHENHGQTVRALLAIFAALQRLHLRAVSVPQLLSDDPPSTAQVRAGGSGCGLAAGALASGH
jgi:peptidoglycan/xylan/chitin deacetylase (PgdA/CDA1 family)